MASASVVLLLRVKEVTFHRSKLTSRCLAQRWPSSTKMSYEVTFKTSLETSPRSRRSRSSPSSQPSRPLWPRRNSSARQAFLSTPRCAWRSPLGLQHWTRRALRWRMQPILALPLQICPLQKAVKVPQARSIQATSTPPRTTYLTKSGTVDTRRGRLRHSTWRSLTLILPSSSSWTRRETNARVRLRACQMPTRHLMEEFSPQMVL